MSKDVLIREYIRNYDELSSIVKKHLLEDLKVFNTKIFEALVSQKRKGKYTFAIILLKDRKFTDIPEWKHLKGIKYKDHPVYGTHLFYKTFDEVRGWGGNPTVIGEEWILAKDKDIFNVVRHEVAHEIHSNLISKELWQKITEAFNNAKNNKLFLRKSSALDEYEYFADGVTFYYNTAPSGKIEVFDMTFVCNREELKKRDRVLHDLIEDIFVNGEYEFKK